MSRIPHWSRPVLQSDDDDENSDIVQAAKSTSTKCRKQGLKPTVKTRTNEQKGASSLEFSPAVSNTSLAHMDKWPSPPRRKQLVQKNVHSSALKRARSQQNPPVKNPQNRKSLRYSSSSSADRIPEKDGNHKLAGHKAEEVDDDDAWSTSPWRRAQASDKTRFPASPRSRRRLSMHLMPTPGNSSIPRNAFQDPAVGPNSKMSPASSSAVLSSSGANLPEGVDDDSDVENGFEQKNMFASHSQQFKGANTRAIQYSQTVSSNVVSSHGKESVPSRDFCSPQSSKFFRLHRLGSSPASSTFQIYAPSTKRLSQTAAQHSATSGNANDVVNMVEDVSEDETTHVQKLGPRQQKAADPNLNSITATASHFSGRANQKEDVHSQAIGTRSSGSSEFISDLACALDKAPVLLNRSGGRAMGQLEGRMLAAGASLADLSSFGESYTDHLDLCGSFEGTPLVCAKAKIPLSFRSFFPGNLNSDTFPETLTIISRNASVLPVSNHSTRECTQICAIKSPWRFVSSNGGPILFCHSVSCVDKRPEGQDTKGRQALELSWQEFCSRAFPLFRRIEESMGLQPLNEMASDAGADSETSSEVLAQSSSTHSTSEKHSVRTEVISSRQRFQGILTYQKHMFADWYFIIIEELEPGQVDHHKYIMVNCDQTNLSSQLSSLRPSSHLEGTMVQIQSARLPWPHESVPRFDSRKTVWIANGLCSSGQRNISGMLSDDSTMPSSIDVPSLVPPCLPNLASISSPTRCTVLAVISVFNALVTQGDTALKEDRGLGGITLSCLPRSRIYATMQIRSLCEIDRDSHSLIVVITDQELAQHASDRCRAGDDILLRAALYRPFSGGILMVDALTTLESVQSLPSAADFQRQRLPCSQLNALQLGMARMGFPSIGSASVVEPSLFRAKIKVKDILYLGGESMCSICLVPLVDVAPSLDESDAAGPCLICPKCGSLGHADVCGYLPLALLADVFPTDDEIHKSGFRAALQVRGSRVDQLLEWMLEGEEDVDMQACVDSQEGFKAQLEKRDATIEVCLLRDAWWDAEIASDGECVLKEWFPQRRRKEAQLMEVLSIFAS